MATSNDKIRMVPRPVSDELAILEKLRDRAERVGYGTVVCELQVHQGRIKQVEITAIREKMRADYD